MDYLATVHALQLRSIDAGGKHGQGLGRMQSSAAEKTERLSGKQKVAIERY
jgi:hypothetical protein